MLILSTTRQRAIVPALTLDGEHMLVKGRRDLVVIWVVGYLPWVEEVQCTPWRTLEVGLEADDRDACGRVQRAGTRAA